MRVRWARRRGGAPQPAARRRPAALHLTPRSRTAPHTPLCAPDHYNLTSFLTPSARRIEAWETAPASWPVRLGLTRAMGYVPAPSTALPGAGGNAEAREAMTQFWSTFSLSNMGQRQAQAQGAGAGAGAGAEAGEEGGGGGSGGGSVFRLGSGARAPPAPGSFTGQGRVLGAGGASAAAAAGPAAGGAAAPMDADARRALAAAAAEARMQASSRSQRGAAAAAPAPAAAAAEAASAAGLSGFASSADAASSENEPLLHFSAPQQQQPQQQQQQPQQPAGRSDEHSASLRACLEMGFSEEDSLRALAQSKGDLSLAIDLLANS
jgi:hypothetical protein